jgi:hypothetical protein
MNKSKNIRQINSRYTLPSGRSKNSYRKFTREKMFPKGLSKYFNS